MKRYHLLSRGVMDTTTGRPVLPGSMAWETEYLPWFASGEFPDPEPIIPPSADDLAQQVEQAARAAMRADLKIDATIQFLRTHTPLECETWVAANVNDLATAKNVLGKLAMVVAYLARERLNNFD